ncbi:molybdopterin-guanine dinucleotide biosynthesis protein B [Paenibacillus sp. 1_12]|uniref:molybdopterin-guanine dinucleotide biosynthesis protein B n=1 Tax=Paenibacillus sp. 1_12 TaxID=1566278 RepID=UPI0008EC7079|nr:molybdopterin-guanine dinucleotide biosynthesis protein B [Paenibacillus sp. 1_12]SFL27401.1 molybdopterin-guanine dinucleotide biosynthesis protein B [Paenibacillus sp. 1_12]
MAAVIGFAGFSNSGKTRLISQLVRYFTQLNLRCAVVKHDAHGHYTEASGKDSSQFVEAGAAATAIISPHSFVVIQKVPITLEGLLSRLQSDGFDLILIEGFKKGNHDQVAIFRDKEQAGILTELTHLPIAVVAPEKLKAYSIEGVPFFDSDDLASIAGWIQTRM